MSVKRCFSVAVIVLMAFFSLCGGVFAAFDAQSLFVENGFLYSNFAHEKSVWYLEKSIKRGKKVRHGAFLRVKLYHHKTSHPGGPCHAKNNTDKSL